MLQRSKSLQNVRVSRYYVLCIPVNCDLSSERFPKSGETESPNVACIINQIQRTVIIHSEFLSHRRMSPEILEWKRARVGLVTISEDVYRQLRKPKNNLEKLMLHITGRLWLDALTSGSFFNCKEQWDEKGRQRSATAVYASVNTSLTQAALEYYGTFRSSKQTAKSAASISCLRLRLTIMSGEYKSLMKAFSNS